MGLKKSLKDLLNFKGRLPPEIKFEAYELYNMGRSLHEIDNAIDSEFD